MALVSTELGKAEERVGAIDYLLKKKKATERKENMRERCERKAAAWLAASRSTMRSCSQT
eukprot:7240432-Pyramimonas_sp.AAC.1